jgi:hypothetical protein
MTVSVTRQLKAGLPARCRVRTKYRHDLDRTDLQQQRSIADLMRYVAMYRGRFGGGDALANHHGFIPADPPRFQKLPDPQLRLAIATSI